MSDSKVVVSDLGPKTSVQWAEAQSQRKDFDLFSSRESLLTKEATSTIQPSELDRLFGTDQARPSWANFSPPPGFNEQPFSPLSLFGTGIIPSLGNIQTIQDSIPSLPSSDQEGATHIQKLLSILSGLETTQGTIRANIQRFQRG